MRSSLLILLLAGFLASNKTAANELRLDLDGGLKALALKCGLITQGKVVLQLRGKASAFRCLNQLIPESEGERVENARLKIEKAKRAVKLDSQVLLLAKKEFGLPEFWRQHPEYDGRGVTVGVIDNGLGPHHQGFQKTTTGKRKYLGHFSSSSFYHFSVSKVLEENQKSDYLKSAKILATSWWQGAIDETRKTLSDKQIDLNHDGEHATLALAVFKTESDEAKICVDKNANKLMEEEQECFGTFQKTGDYRFWDAHNRIALHGEFDEKNRKVLLNEGEYDGDAHGEGVASVMAGHQIGGRFDGVAPGAFILDYDLSEETNQVEEGFYTLGTFLSGIETLAQAGADVINMSYSLFFYSPQSQVFMAKALDELVKKYNVVLTFSAGNNGPGLGSLNRRSIYPDSVLVVGAYVSKELDEYVHGVSGLPDQGRVIYYSSRGPGPDGRGPSVISPLASLAHGDPDTGFMAFSGTSSAAPATGGLAAVLISAIRHNKLPFYAETLVEAIQASGKRLEGVPFVEQGAGLPQAAKAFAIYQEMLRGERFQKVRAEVYDRKGRGGIDARGIVIKRSDKVDSLEWRGFLAGQLSPELKPSSTFNYLEVINFSANSDKLIAPRKFWLQAGTSFFSADVRLDNFDWNELDRGEEFLELDINNDDQQFRYSTIPVTLIDDAPLGDGITQLMTIGPEEGKRLHFHVPAGVPGIIVRVKVLSGPDKRLYTALYNPSGVRVERTSFETEMTASYPLEGAGHYQIALAKSKGAGRETQLEINVTPMRLHLHSTGVSLDAKEVAMFNRGKQQVGQLILESAPIIHRQKVVPAKKWQEEMKVDFELSDELDEYRVEVKALNPPDQTYLISYCFLEARNLAGEIVARAEDKIKAFQLKGLDGVKVHATCRSFDWPLEKNKAPGELLISVLGTKLSHFRQALPVNLGRGKSHHTFSQLTKAGEYLVKFVSSNAGVEVPLGEIAVIE